MIESTYNDMVAAGILDHICNQLGSDRRSTLVLLVLPSIVEVWDDGCDPPGAGRLASMDHDEQFHEGSIGGCRCSRRSWTAASCIDNVDVVLSDRLCDSDDRLARFIAGDCSLAKGLSEPGEPER